MSDSALMSDDVRQKILSNPDVVLEDQDVMRALVAANERMMGGNIVDMRGIAMERLEARLDRLEDTHRGVIAAAYDNLAGTNMVHRAILKMLEARSFEKFLSSLGREVQEILRVDGIKLVLETAQGGGGDQALDRLSDILMTAEPGFIDAYLTRGRNVPVRQVTLRQVNPETDIVFGEASSWVQSEACIRLDLGAGRLPGMLVMGAEDPHQFKPSQGTDLLSFFGGVFELTMRRWLD